MKTLQRCVHILGATLVAVSSVTTVHAQQVLLQPAKQLSAINRPAVRIQFDSTRIRRVTRPAIAFRAFDSIDVRTGRAINMDSVATLRNGKRITRRQWLAETNRLERNLNALGYSLRDTARVVVIGEQRTDTVTLAAQRRALLSASVGPYRPISLQESQRRLDVLPALTQATSRVEVARLDTAVANVLVWRRSDIPTAVLPAQPNAPSAQLSVQYPISWEWSKAFPFGNPSNDALAASFGVQSKLYGDTNQTSLHASASADVWLEQHQFDVLDATADAKAPKEGAGSVAVAVSALGDRIWDKSYSLPSGAIGDAFTYPLKHEVNFAFPTGLGFDIDVALGTNGTLGVHYGVGITPLGLAADIRPYV